jgi:FkbM family methyltransferase
LGKQYNTIVFNKLPSISESYVLLDEIQKRMKSILPHKIDSPIILYGAGNLGKLAKQYFDKLEIPILFVVDNNADSISDPFWKDIEIFKPTEIPFHARLKCIIIVCIVTSSFMELYNMLSNFSYINIIPFYDITLLYQDKHPLNNGWIQTELNTNDITNIKYVLSNLKDDTSRAHHLQFIAWHTLHEELIFNDNIITNYDRYFIPEILSILHNDETFIDIGAHHGEVTKTFIKNVNNKFNRIYLIEPDINNMNILLKTLDHPINKFTLFPYAVGNKTEEKKFYYGLDYASQLSELSSEYTKVKELDELNIDPTFIKIHTEGNELDIIKSGLETITNSRPILVITTYHNNNGLWKLPYYLMNTLTDYIYYIRLHSWCGTGSVVYAIPKERIQ